MGIPEAPTPGLLPSLIPDAGLLGLVICPRLLFTQAVELGLGAGALGTGWFSSPPACGPHAQHIPASSKPALGPARPGATSLPGVTLVDSPFCYLLWAGSLSTKGQERGWQGIFPKQPLVQPEPW